MSESSPSRTVKPTALAVGTAGGEAASRHAEGAARRKATLHDVSTVRLYLLRGMYLLIAVGLGSMIWPLVLDPPPNLEHMRGVAWSLFGALSLLAVLGVRYPLRMLPLLLFELTWKVIWVLAIGLPLWSAGRLDPAHSATLWECLMGVVVVPLVMPWRYVLHHYLRAPGDRWSTASS